MTLKDYSDVSLKSLLTALKQNEVLLTRALTEESFAIRNRVYLDQEREALRAAIMKLERSMSEK